MFTFYRELLCHNNDGTFGGWRVYVLAVKFNIRNMHDEISMKNDSEWALNSWFSLWLLSLCISFFSLLACEWEPLKVTLLCIYAHKTLNDFSMCLLMFNPCTYGNLIFILSVLFFKVGIDYKTFFCKIINKKFKIWNNKIQQLNVKTFKTSRPSRALRVSSLENLFHLLLFFI